MIVDLHTRVWDSVESLGDAVAEQARRRRGGPWEPMAAAFDTHESAMSPVSFAFVHGLESELLSAHVSMKQVADTVARSPDTLLGFAGIDPSAGNPVTKLAQAVALGLVGVTISPAAAGFHPCSTGAMQLYEACEARGLPVYIEAGAHLARQARMEFGQPFLLDEVARSFPRLKLVVGGFGDPWPQQTIALLAKHPCVYTDISGLVTRPWPLYNALVSAFQAEVMQQVFFASGFPHTAPEEAIVTLYRVNTLTKGTPLPGIPREQLRGIVERETLADLGIKTPQHDAQADAKSSSAFEQIVVREAARA